MTPAQAPNLMDIRITPGVDGFRLWVDGIVMRSGLTATDAMHANHETRRLAMVAAHDALWMLAKTLNERRAS